MNHISQILRLRDNQSRRRDSAQIPPDDVPADSGFFDKKYGIHVIRTYVLGAESIRNGDFNASTKG